MADIFETKPNNFGTPKSITKYLDHAGLISFWGRVKDYVDNQDLSLFNLIKDQNGEIADLKERMDEYDAIGGGSNIQPDWNNNTPGKPGYIENRTHYINYETINSYSEQGIPSYIEKPYTVCFNGRYYTLVEGENRLSWDPPMLVHVVYEGDYGSIRVDESSHLSDDYPLQLITYVQKLPSIYLPSSNLVLIPGSGEGTGMMNHGTAEVDGDYSVSFGYNSFNGGLISLTSGSKTEANADLTHAEGYDTKAGRIADIIDINSCTIDLAKASARKAEIAELLNTAVEEGLISYDGIFDESNILDYIGSNQDSVIRYFGIGAHVEGKESQALGTASHAEGELTQANGNASHAEGKNTIASGHESHAEGQDTRARGHQSHAEGIATVASGTNAHAEGDSTKASGYASHAEGISTIASGTNTHAEGELTQAIGNDSHAEGYGTQATGNQSHAEGDSTQAIGNDSHAGGNGSIAEGDRSFAHGDAVQAKGANALALGKNSIAAGHNSIAAGHESQTNNTRSFAMGYICSTGGNDSMAFGYECSTGAAKSAAIGNRAKTTNVGEFACGSYNATSSTQLFSVGCGTSDTSRKNAFHVINNSGTIKAYINNKEISVVGHTHNPSDLGLSGAMKYCGKTTTTLSDGDTTNPIVIGGSNFTAVAGNVVIDNNNHKEFIWDGSKWELLGDEGSYKIKQSVVNDPNASGTSTTFIDTISQDENGKITVTKKNIPTIPTKLSQLTDDVVTGNYIRATVYGLGWDADSLYDAGVHSGDISHLPSGLPYGVIYTLPYRKSLGNTKPDYASQIFIPSGDDSTSPNDMFFRTSLADTWNTWTKVITDKNIGNYKSGDSAKLDGYLPSSIYVGTRGHIKSGADLSALAPGGYYVGAAVNSTNPLPTDYASLSVLGNDYYSSQLCVKHDSTRAWIRGTYPSKKEVSNWHELAFTDSNVASATTAGSADSANKLDAEYLTDLNNGTIGRLFFSAFQAANTPPGANYFAGLTFGSDSIKQIAMSYDGNLYTRYSNKTKWSDWKRVAFTSDIPTKLSQLTDDVVTGKYLPLSKFQVAEVANPSTVYLQSGIYRQSEGSHLAPGTTGWSQFITLFAGGDNWAQMYFSYDGRLHYRTATLYDGDPANIPWTAIITEKNIGNYNAGSATKLQTPRKLWGNDFDGTADVNGLMYVGNEFHIEHPTTGRQLGISPYWTILGYNNPMIGNPTYVDGRNVYIRYGNDEYTSVFASTGNVGIGTTSPTEKLDVAGNIKMSGNLFSDIWRIIKDSKWDGTFIQSANYDGTSELGNIYMTAMHGKKLTSFNVWANNSEFSDNVTVGGNINASSVTVSGNDIIHSGNIKDQYVAGVYDSYNPLMKITFNYAGDAVTSNPTWLACWNGYTLSYVSPDNVKAGSATVFGSSDFKVYAENSNEINFGGTAPKTNVYFGYRDKDGIAVPLNYYFGSSGGANVRAGNFIKSGSSDSYVLLGGGGHKSLSDFSDTNYYHTRSYSSGLQISTGTGVSNMYVPYATASQAGVVSTGDQTFAGAKTFTGNVTAKAFYISSDERLKTFGDDIKVDFDELAKLRKSHFVFNNNPTKQEIGVSAQEVQKIYPEIVNETEEGTLSVDYSKLAVVALAAIDKLNQRVQELENKLAKYE